MSSSTERRAWEREYAEVHAYTTSYRDELDRGVEFLLGYVAASGLTLRSPLLECACGRGRNAIPLAQQGYTVVGLDHARHALGQFLARAADDAVTGVLAVQHDLRQPLPIGDQSVGGVLDVTAVDNLVDADARRAYGLEVHRVLRPGGLALVVTFDRDDGYYAPFLPAADDDGVCEDPHTGIRNQLFRGPLLDEVFAPPLERLAANRFDFIDEAAQERWTRRFLLRVYRRPER